jgi:prepilin-type N-terminal cleavage/methylation domain-containing protein
MQLRDNARGFSIIEVMIAIVVLVTGLLGVAAMQTKAMQCNMSAGRYTSGSAAGAAWMEWLMNQPYDKVAALDVNMFDTQPTERQLPDSNETILENFQEWGLGTFSQGQLPNAIRRGCNTTWRITANSPVQNTTTVEIETMVSIARLEKAEHQSAMAKPLFLRFMMSSHR